MCTGNFYRSRFSEAIFNHHVQLLGIPTIAISRGFYTQRVSSRSLTDLSPFTKDVLIERNISLALTGAKRMPLTIEDLLEAHRVIALSEKEHSPMAVELFPDHADDARAR